MGIQVLTLRRSSNKTFPITVDGEVESKEVA
jgi:hypothetical protein